MSRRRHPAISSVRTRAPEAKSPLLSVCDGQTCCGFVLSRGRDGFESFNWAGKSIGKFPTQQEAVRAIPRRKREATS
jgi:hypothetical protein